MAASMYTDVEDSVYYITASLVTFFALLMVVRYFQRKPCHKKEEQDNLHKQSTKRSGDNQLVDDSDIDDLLLIKPEEVEKISGSPTVADDGADDEDDKDFRCDSLQGKLKQAKHKKIKEKLECNMTENQISAESEARTNQLEAIFKLMEQSKDTFGIENMTEVKDQLKLYAIN